MLIGSRIPVRINPHRITNGANSLVVVHGKIDHELSEAGMLSGDRFIEVFSNRFRRQSRRPHPKFIYISAIIISTIAVATNVKSNHLTESIVFIHAAVPQRSIQVYRHDTCRGILRKRPVIPFALKLVSTSRLINAVVPSIESSIPVHPAVGPGQMDVDLPLVAGIYTFTDAVVFRLKFSCAALPKLHCHCILNGIKPLRSDFHAIVAIKTNKFTCCSRLPCFLRGLLHRKQSRPITRSIQLEPRLNHQMTRAIPSERFVQDKLTRNRVVRDMAYRSRNAFQKCIERINLGPMKRPLYRVARSAQTC